MKSRGMRRERYEDSMREVGNAYHTTFQSEYLKVNLSIDGVIILK
jgi:hypothetical protein